MKSIGIVAGLSALLLVLFLMLSPKYDRGPSDLEWARIQIQKGFFEAPILKFKIDCGRIPSAEEGLNALISSPRSLEYRWKGPYIKNAPLDPWGNEIIYRVLSESRFRLTSLGPDGVRSDDDLSAEYSLTSTTPNK